MSNTYLMRQCTLVKDNRVMTATIPEKYAIAGKVIGLKDDGVWDEGWTVRSVGDVAIKSDVMNERSRDYLNTRKASDI